LDPDAVNVKIFNDGVESSQFFVFDLTLDANWQLAKTALQTHLSTYGNTADDFM